MNVTLEAKRCTVCGEQLALWIEANRVVCLDPCCEFNALDDDETWRAG